MIPLELLEDVFRFLLWIDTSRSFNQRLLILSQLRVADLQESRQRHIDHLVVQKFQTIILRSDRERCSGGAKSRLISAKMLLVTALEYVSGFLRHICTRSSSSSRL